MEEKIIYGILGGRIKLVATEARFKEHVEEVAEIGTYFDPGHADCPIILSKEGLRALVAAAQEILGEGPVGRVNPGNLPDATPGKLSAAFRPCFPHRYTVRGFEGDKPIRLCIYCGAPES